MQEYTSLPIEDCKNIVGESQSLPYATAEHLVASSLLYSFIGSCLQQASSHF